MKNFRIHYQMIGVTYKKLPVATVKAASAEEAARKFASENRWASIVAIFAA